METDQKSKDPPFYTDISTLDVVEISPPEHIGKKIGRFLLRNLLLLLLICALLLGIALGAGLRAVEPRFDERQIMYLRFPGELLMNMLQMMILPLIVSSLISGLASLDTRSSGRLGLRAIVYYLTTTLAAVILGIILVVSIEPGRRGNTDIQTSTFKKVHPADPFLDLLRQCFPSNLIQACFEKPVTSEVEVEPEVETAVNMTGLASTTVAATATTLNENATVEKQFKPVTKNEPSMNILGLVVFSIFFGIMIGKMEEKGKPLKDLFDSLCEITMRLITLVIWYSPIGVMFLVAAKVVEMKDPVETFQQLLYYFLTVMAGLIAHGFITLPILYFVIVRKNPFKYMYGVVQALVTALGTSSSSATLPVTMRCLEENNGVDERVTKFVAPVGATINMDGTALYEAVAVIFIGQVRGFDLGIGQIITISITSTAAAIGAAGVPQAGLVTMVIVLTAVGFPTDDVTLILAIDWLLDRFRTAINVLGDAFGAGIVAHLSRADLAKMDEQDNEKAELQLEQSMPNGHTNTAFEEERL